MAVPSSAPRVHRLVPFVHVTDVEASLAFYALLGFASVNVMRDSANGRAFWAFAETAKGREGTGGHGGAPAQIMFAQANPDPDPEQQAVIFYMYSTDVAALRSHLLAGGLFDGGAYRGQQGPNNGRRVVFAVSHPHYMTSGELRIADPDGYCILVGQLE